MDFLTYGFKVVMAVFLNRRKVPVLYELAVGPVMAWREWEYSVNKPYKVFGFAGKGY